jgi:hypothetical protein
MRKGGALTSVGLTWTQFQFQAGRQTIDPLVMTLFLSNKFSKIMVISNIKWDWQNDYVW